MFVKKYVGNVSKLKGWENLSKSQKEKYLPYAKNTVDEEGLIQAQPFQNICAVVTGKFKVSGKNIANRLALLGAKVDARNLTRKCNLCIVGGDPRSINEAILASGGRGGGRSNPFDSQKYKQAVSRGILIVYEAWIEEALGRFMKEGILVVDQIREEKRKRKRESAGGSGSSGLYKQQLKRRKIK